MPTLVPELGVLRGYKGEVMVASSAINVLSLALPIVILQVYDRVIPNNAEATLLAFMIGLGIVLFLDMLLNLARAYITGWTGARVQHKLGCITIERLFRSDLRAFETSPHGVHLQRLRAVDSIKTFFSGQGILLMVDLPFAVLFFALIWLIAGKLVLFPIAILCILAFFARANGKSLSKALEDRATNNDRRNNFMVEVLRNIHTVKVLGMETLMVRRYELLQKSSAVVSSRISSTGSSARSVGNIFSQLTAIAVGAYGSTMVIDGVLTIGGLAASTLLASRSAQPMLRALGIWSQFQSARISRGKVVETLQLPQESDPTAPALSTTKGNIELVDVEFGFEGTKEPLLRDINIKISSRETIGIAGANGSGKSTLLGLIMGLMVPGNGRVMIDGEDVWNFDAASLRSQVCYLPQKAVLFQGTILENLTMFQDDEHIERAIRMSERLGLHEMIGRMADGYQTRIEHSANSGLSGGIRQRIALVRALAHNEHPKILLFDEANIHLDKIGDALLLEVLERYCGKCSMAIVSHRPSYLDLADRLYVIHDRTLKSSQTGNRVRESLEQIENRFGG